MTIYYSLKKNLVDKISFEKFKKASFSFDDEIEPDQSVFVVDVRENGNQVSFVGFSNEEEAKDFFISKAYDKFSNWEDYSAEDVESVFDRGYEKTSGGSLSLCFID